MDIKHTTTSGRPEKPVSNPGNIPARVAVIGAGPAGLMAAETIANAGFTVHVYDAKPSAARKFLLAGIGGMNITHAEDWPLFISRYGKHRASLQPLLQQFGPGELRQWIHNLGITTFVGSSGRVFPADMKAAPLLRAWLHRLREQGVEFHMRHRCMGWHDNKLVFHTGRNEAGKTSQVSGQYSATVLALGGGSWPQLGSDGTWQHWLSKKGVAIKPLQAANCGFNVSWSQHIRQQFAGTPVKNAELSFTDNQHQRWHKRGEFVISAYGIEGSAVYALSAPLRDALQARAAVTLHIDLSPDRSIEQIKNLLEQHRKGMSLGNLLRKKLHFTAAEAALLHEFISQEAFKNPAELARQIKSLPLEIDSARPLEEAISTAGGIDFSNLTHNLMIRNLPGVFCAGEMLDWEAPTGGYLLTACFSTGLAAGNGVVTWLNQQHHD